MLEIKTGVLAEVSEVSEELGVYAVRERKCWTETEILDVLIVQTQFAEYGQPEPG